MSMAIAYLALGSNLGDRARHMHEAIQRLGPDVVVEALSPIYETEPHYVREQPAFYNAVVRVQTDLSPEDLLANLKNIEKAVGRTKTFRNGPRVIDLDILLYDDRQMDSPPLTIPHPRMHERTFVLAPLTDIAPNLVHPRLRLRMRDLLQKISSRGVVRIAQQI